jgi:hypothetical protein
MSAQENKTITTTANKLFTDSIKWNRRHGSLKTEFDAIVVAMAIAGISWADMLKTAQTRKDWPKNENGKAMGRDAAVKTAPESEAVSTFKRLNSYRSLYRVADDQNGIPILDDSGTTYKIKAKNAPTPPAAQAPQTKGGEGGEGGGNSVGEDIDRYEQEVSELFKAIDKELAGLPQAKQRTLVELIAKLKKLTL